MGSLQLEMLVFFVVFVWFIATQIAIPFGMGTKLFPLFRAKRVHQLEDELKDVKQEGIEEQIWDEIRAHREALEKHRHHTEPQPTGQKKGDGNAA